MDLWSEILNSIGTPIIVSYECISSTTERSGEMATETKIPCRLNIHLGDMSGETALGMAQRIANRTNARVYLVAEPDFEPESPKGLLVKR
jgi:hypothetical protein